MNEELQQIVEALKNSNVSVARSRRRDRIREADLPSHVLRWNGPRGGFGREGEGIRAGFNIRYEAYTRGREKRMHLLITVTPGGPADTEFYTDDVAGSPPHPNRMHSDSWDDWDGDKQAGLGRIIEVFGGI